MLRGRWVEIGDVVAVANVVCNSEGMKIMWCISPVLRVATIYQFLQDSVWRNIFEKKFDLSLCSTSPFSFTASFSSEFILLLDSVRPLLYNKDWHIFKHSPFYLLQWNFSICREDNRTNGSNKWNGFTNIKQYKTNTKHLQNKYKTNIKQSKS